MKYIVSVALFVVASVGLLSLPFVQAGTFLPILAKYKGGPVTGGGSIRGTVTLAKVPTLAELAIGKDEQVCAAARKSPRLVYDAATKGLGNVVVYIDKIEAGKPKPKDTVIVDQKNCQYSPHITIVPARSKLWFRSSDPILHNVHVYQGTPEKPHARTKDVFNSAMKDKNVPNTPFPKRAMRKPGFYAVQCDAGHIWMSAYIWVVEHPYYVLTDAKGNFELKDVPPGQYTLKFWHENWEAKADLRDGKTVGYTYGAPKLHSARVTVEAGKAAVVNWTVE